MAGRKRKGGGAQYLPSWLAKYVNGHESPDGASVRCDICGAWSRVCVYVRAIVEHGVVVMPAFQCCPDCAATHAPRYAAHTPNDLMHGRIREVAEPVSMTLDWSGWGRTATAPARCDGVPSRAAMCPRDADATGSTAPATTEVR